MSAALFEQLKRSLAGSPRALLQKLADVALELCGAQSAGVSLLEEAGGRRFFRWHAVAGEWRNLIWSTLPREFSPCGTVLDRRAALLMVEPERYFTPLTQISPRVAEALLVPFGALTRFAAAYEMLGSFAAAAKEAPLAL